MTDYVLYRIEGLSWAQFLELFINRFVSKSFKDQKQWAFEALKLNGRTVDEHASKFLELSIYDNPKKICENRWTRVQGWKHRERHGT